MVNIYLAYKGEGHWDSSDVQLWPRSQTIVELVELILRAKGIEITESNRLPAQTDTEDRLAQLWNNIEEADGVIAFMGERSKRVATEIAVAHLLGKRVLLLCPQEDEQKLADAGMPGAVPYVGPEDAAKPVGVFADSLFAAADSELDL